jgi:hypothetical protein
LKLERTKQEKYNAGKFKKEGLKSPQLTNDKVELLQYTNDLKNKRKKSLQFYQEIIMKRKKIDMTSAVFPNIILNCLNDKIM